MTTLSTARNRHRPDAGPARAVLLAAACWMLLAFATQGFAVEPPPGAYRHWAYQPPRRVPPPAVRNPAWPRNDLDRFILARLEATGRSPAPAADPRTFLRRIHAGLLGLPPSHDEVLRFTDEARAGNPANGPLDSGAVARLVQRLLSSPQYGERWGRHWLDVARYSDTKGYVYTREERFFVHAPTYRDWVVQAFNHDMPYDRFLLLQIAADRLVAPNSPDLAAMGFLTGGRRFLGVTHDIVDDRIDVVTRGALGLTVQCARCHDHKYDPVPTQDYYSLYGVFGPNDVRLVPLSTVQDAELDKRRGALEAAYRKHRDAANHRLRSRIGEYLTAQLELEKYPEEGFEQILDADDIIPMSVRRWRDYLLTRRDPDDPIFGPWHRIVGNATKTAGVDVAASLAELRAKGTLNPLVAEAFVNPPESEREVATRYGKVFALARQNPNTPGAGQLLAFLESTDSPTTVPETGLVNTEYLFPTSVTEELGKLEGDIERRMIELDMPAALVLTDRPPEPDPRVFLRGSPARLGEPVPRRFLGILSRKERPTFSRGSGRLELARAVVDPTNPLTARVMVNRIWQHHFGTGLVPTSSDLGVRAQAPWDPALLDWLALRFVDEGWSVKAIHRLVLTSATYQQSADHGSGHGTDAEPADGAGVRPAPLPESFPSPFPRRRLDFEQLRDSMLAVSGELDLTGRGRPKNLLDPSNRRRTLYSLVDRQFLEGTLRTFDFANPDIHVAVRHQTTVPQQALFFLNGTFAAARATALAASVEAMLPEQRVRRIHQAVFQRDPTAREVELGLRFVKAAGSRTPPPPEPRPPSSWTYGTGEYDDHSKSLKSFTALPHFSGDAWQGADAWPGGATGWARITAEGGHPGDTLAHACVRRWTAPSNVVVHVSGTLRHEPEAGDGIRAFVVSSRQGEVRAVTAHHSTVDISFDNLALQAGDTLDFIVDIAGNLNSDQFLWSPVVSAKPATWNSKADFAGPKPQPRLLEPWPQYAQVLLLSNEFAFVD